MEQFENVVEENYITRMIVCKRRSTKEGRSFNSFYGKNKKNENCEFKFLDSKLMASLSDGVYDVTFNKNQNPPKPVQYLKTNKVTGETSVEIKKVYYINDVISATKHEFETVDMTGEL